MAVFVGTSSGNSLEGGVDNDTLYGLGGDDTLFGGGLDDFLFGGSGANSLDGGLGNDTYWLDSATDILIDAGGLDLARIGAGASGIVLADSIESASAWGSGARTITGGASANTLTGGAVGDLLDGGDGADRLSGKGGGDTLTGGLQDDRLDGGDGGDSLFGGGGNDILMGGAGTNSLDGGLGDDTFFLDGATDVLIDSGGIDVVRVGAGASGLTLGDDIENASAWGTGARTVTGGSTANILSGGAEGDLLDGAGGGDRLFGEGGNDTLAGGLQADQLDGGAGDDSLFGGDGADRLVGGAGTNTLDGGLGDDLYYLGSATDVIVDSGGIDQARIGAGASGIVLTADIENASAWGTGGRTITGNAGGNVLAGGASADLLEGGGGNDRLRGGGGDDTLTGGAGNDQFVFLGSGNGSDTIADFVAGEDEIVLGGGVTVDSFAGATLVLSGGTTIVAGNGHVWTENDFQSNDIDLSTLAPAQGFIVQGDVAGDAAGFSVSSAGDVNGDGFADLIVGAPSGDDGGAGAGEAYVVFGIASGFGTVDGTGRAVIDLSNVASSFTPAQGFIVQGDATGDAAGYSVSSAGDVNGDGFADLIVGARNGDDGGDAAGEAYVVFGTDQGFGTLDGTGRAVIDLSNVAASFTAAQGFIVQGAAVEDHAGNSVSSAGDINGDGFADLIVGAPYGDHVDYAAGEAYVVFGTDQGFGTVDGTGRAVIDLSNTASSFMPAQGFVIQGDETLDLLGRGVSSAGDVNGDGFSDLIVGAAYGDDGGNNAGEAYVVFGHASGFGTVDGTGRAVIDLSNVASSFTPAQGFIVQGDVASDFVGFGLSSAGDVNGDGFSDLIVGAPNGDDGGNSAGEAYVVFGHASGFGTIDGTGRAIVDLSNSASSFAPAVGFILQGDQLTDQAGYSVASAGDVNGDGFDDLIVGAVGANSDVINTGAVYVVFGKASGFGTVDGTGRAVIDLVSLGSADGFLVQGDAENDNLGRIISSAGDVNGDGFSDLIVAARNGDDGGIDAGEAYVLFGAAFGASGAPVTSNGTAAADILIGDAGNDTLSGGGGTDVLRGGNGDDMLTVGDLTFRSVDGGGGSDTLVLEGAGQVFDFTTLADNKVSGIEAIDIAGSGDNTLTLGMFDVLNISETAHEDFTAATSHNALVVFGNAGDTLDLVGYDPDGVGSFPEAAWQLVSSGVGLDGTPAGAFDLYDLVRDGSILASVAVDADIVAG